MILWGILCVILVLLGFAAATYFVGRLLNRGTKKGFLLFFARCTLVFALLLGLEATLVRLFPSYPDLLRDSAATAAGGLLKLAGMQNSVSDTIIWIDTSPIAFDITIPCLGIVLFITYIALVFAQPGVTRRERLTGLVLGLGALSVFNICRIAFTCYVEASTGGYVHNIFYYFNMAFVVVIWAGWVWSLKPRPAARTL